jgi:hypothetical protein
MNRLDIRNMIDNLIKKIEDRLYVKKEYVYVALVCLILIFGFSVMNRAANNPTKPAKQAATTENVQNDSAQLGIETQSLRDVGLQIGISADELIAMLQKKGIKLNSMDDTMEQIAKDNQIPMEKLVHIFNNHQVGFTKIKNRPSARFGGLTLEEFCDQKNIPLNEMLSRFEMLGIKVDPKSKMKYIAKDLGVSPTALVEMIER